MFDESGCLECVNVNCCSTYLHEFKTEHFNYGEGREHGSTTTIEDGQVRVETNKLHLKERKNPSSYRQGLKVTFYCEECEAITVLTIAQHKGRSYFQRVEDRTINKPTEELYLIK